MNNGFGPLPVRRGNKSIICAALILVVAIVALCIYETYVGRNVSVFIFLSCMSVVAMFFGELLRRTCLLAEEVYHKQDRYEGSWKKVLHRVFLFQNPIVGDSVMYIFVAIIMVIAFHIYNENSLAISADGADRYLWLLLFLNVIVVPTFGYLAGVKSLATVERSEMNEKQNKNLADGLAWSYYFGYLKLILPELEKQIDRSDQLLRENICRKLLILLPRNCYCYDSLSDSDSRIQPEAKLPTLTTNRAGIQKRQYHNTVYKITIPKDDPSENMKQYEGEYYCLVEYATPLMSLYDMSNDKKAEFSEEDRLEQVKLFFNKLTEILDGDPKCRGKYQLIPLADTCDHLAKVIVEAIKNAPVDVSTEEESVAPNV